MGQHRNAQLVALDDCRLTRLSQIAPSADDLDAWAAPQLDSIEQRVDAPIHCVVARHRGDVETRNR